MATLGRSALGWWTPARLHRAHLGGWAITVGAFAVACSSTDRRADARSARLAEPVAAAQGLTRLAMADSQLERDRWDPDAVVSRAGKDPRQLFGWVARNTQWIPYRGVLRGAAGVLNDRLGNELDRSLLLAVLLQRAGHSVRLAHATLPTARVAELVPRIAAEQLVHAEKQAPFTYDRAAVQDIAHSAGPYADPLSKVLLAVSDTLSRASAELSRRVQDQSARLLRALPRSDPISQRTSWYAEARAALADHWWVQRDSAGTWIDMDLLGDSASSAASHNGAVETVELDSLPGRPVYQEIGVRVVAEYRDGAKLTEQRLLDYALRPADVLGQPIVLQFWPARWFTDSVARAEMSQRPLARIPDEHEFGAMLVVGDRTVAVAGFRDSSESDVEKAAEAGGPMGGLAGGLSNALGVKQRRPADLTAVWLEYEFRVPGDSARTERREVFDLIGPDARAAGRAPSIPLDSLQRRLRALALTMRTELVPVNCRLAGAFVNQLSAEALRSNARELASLSDGFGKRRPTLNELAVDATPLPSPLLMLAVARVAWSPYVRDIYVARAGLLTRHVGLVPLGNRLGLRDAVDIVANDVGVGPMARDPFATRLSQGVFDTNAEALLWANPGSENVGDAYAASASWRVVPPHEIGEVDRLPLPDDVKQRVRTEVAAGDLVLAPATKLQVHGQPFAGWWRVDRVTGRTLGMGASGWGVQSENSALVRQRITWSQYFIELARLAAPRFTHAFGTTLVICMVYTAGEDASAGRSLEAHAEVAHSFTECVGDSFVIAAMATVPLLMITMDEMAAIRAARLAGGALAMADGLGKGVPETSEPLPKEQKPPEQGSKKPPPPQEKPPEPGSQKSPPPEGKPPEPGPEKSPPPEPNPSKEPPDLAKTQPQEQPPPDRQSPLAKSLPPGADPASQKSPLATTQGGGEDPGLDKTQPQPPPNDPSLDKTQPQPQPAPDEGQPVDRSELTPQRQELLDWEQQLVEKYYHYQETQSAAQQAANDYLQYEANDPTDPRHTPVDPSKWDPATSQQLYNKSYDALKTSFDAADDVTNQLNKINGRRSRFQAIGITYDQIPTARPGQFIGCPPNCARLTE